MPIPFLRPLTGAVRQQARRGYTSVLEKPSQKPTQELPLRLQAIRLYKEVGPIITQIRAVDEICFKADVFHHSCIDLDVISKYKSADLLLFYLLLCLVNEVGSFILLTQL